MFGQLSLVAIVVSSALSAVLAGTAAWTYQSSRYEAQLADMRLSAAQAIRKTEQKYAEALRVAEDKAKARARALRVDADRARLTADGLRDDLARAVRAAQDSPATCPDTAATLSDVLRSMEAEGRGLAEACDRHTNDIRTLIEAWPE